MPSDYASILKKAVAQIESAGERRAIYDRARKAVAGLHPRDNLTIQQIAIEARALEAAIREIEYGVEAEDPDASQISPLPAEVLKEPANWKGVAVIAGVFFLLVGTAGFALWYFVGRNPHAGSELEAAAGRVEMRDKVVADLPPGVDGGSSSSDLPFPLQRQVVFYRSTVVPGSIVVDRENRYLYVIETDTSARRYGIGISGECLKSGSLYRVVAKKEWPEWRQDDKALADGRGNPLGSRALLLDQPDRVIHGTNSPKSIGHLVASGCIRLVNDDIEHLYKRVSLETRVIMRN